MFALSSAEASLCRREAGEREKRKRVEDDGNPAGASALAEQRVMFAVPWPPSLILSLKKIGESRNINTKCLAVEVRGKEFSPLFDLPQLLSILQLRVHTCNCKPQEPENTCNAH